VRSTIETFGVGTRMEVPFSLPFSSGDHSPIIFAAPVEEGIMLIAAARARRRSSCGRSGCAGRWCSCGWWSSSPRSMPKLSISTLATGARQLVVQLALR